MTSANHNQTFGQTFGARTPHTVIIARGEKVRYFTIRPLTFVVSCALASATVLGCLGTLACLAISDELPGLEAAGQTSLRQAYEGRITSLRSELDRVVSRQLLDQRAVESKVDTLLGQQADLAARYEKLQPLLERARSNGLLPQVLPVPTPKPSDDHAALTDMPAAAKTRLLSFAEEPGNDVLGRFGLVDRGAGPATWKRAPSGASFGTWKSRPGGSAQDLIHAIGRSIDDAEDGQIVDLDRLAEGARRRTESIASALRSEGLSVPGKADTTSQDEGGPFVPVPEAQKFDASFAELDAALTRLQTMRETSEQLPLSAPLTSSVVSSPFGVRPDPFFGRSAMHTGIDFVAASGTDVSATAPGKVIQAGFSGGYGQMVEVDHGGGVTSRYGHLSSILVSVGDRVSPGNVIGKVGTTGRSTGPHLHYEIRRGGEAVNPDRFLRAGRKISSLG